MPYTNFKKSSAAFLNRSYRLTRWWTGLSIAILFAMMAALPGRAETPALCKKEVPRITFENISPPSINTITFKIAFFSLLNTTHPPSA